MISHGGAAVAAFGTADATGDNLIVFFDDELSNNAPAVDPPP